MTLPIDFDNLPEREVCTEVKIAGMDLLIGIFRSSEDPMDIADEIQTLKIDQREHRLEILCKIFFSVGSPETVESDVDHRSMQVFLKVIFPEGLCHRLQEGLLRHIFKGHRPQRLFKMFQFRHDLV